MDDRERQHDYLEKLLLNANLGLSTISRTTATTLATELLDNGVEVTVPLPPQPPVYSLVRIGNGDIWIRSANTNRDNWMLIDTIDTDFASWDDLVAANAQPFYPFK